MGINIAGVSNIIERHVYPYDCYLLSEDIGSIGRHVDIVCCGAGLFLSHSYRSHMIHLTSFSVDACQIYYTVLIHCDVLQSLILPINNIY